RGARAPEGRRRRPPHRCRPGRHGRARRLHRRGPPRGRRLDRRNRRGDRDRPARRRLRRQPRRHRPGGGPAARDPAPPPRLRPRQGRARDGARARRRRPHRSARVVVDVLIAGIVAMVISIVAGPRFINFLRLREYGQPIRAEGPAAHAVKQGTPTMGGLLILFSAAIPYLILSNYSTPALTVCFCAVGCGLIGFLDDFIKVTHRRSLGLNGRWKLLGLALITAVVAWVAYH